MTITQKFLCHQVGSPTMKCVHAPLADIWWITDRTKTLESQ